MTVPEPPHDLVPPRQPAAPPQDATLRRRYVVAVEKIPAAERDVARSVMSDHGAATQRRFLDIVGADTPDDHDEFPVGAHCTYALDLDENEARQFADASNCRWIREDRLVYLPRPMGI